MKVILSCSFVVLAFVAFSQSEGFKYYQNGRIIVELGQTRERIYEYRIQSSNYPSLSIYDLIREIDLKHEPPYELVSGRKKRDQFAEISSTEARKLLIGGFVKAQRGSMEDKLNEQFNFFHRYFTRPSYYYAVTNTCSVYESDNFEIDVEAQRKLILDYYQKEYDSLRIVHGKYNALVEDFLKNEQPITQERSIQLLNELPNLQSRNGSYQAVALQYILSKDPEIYFNYIESLQIPHKLYFNIPNAEQMKTIRRMRSDSPIRKELIKFRRGQNVQNAGVIALSTVIDAAFIGGIVYLIRLL